MLTSGSDGKERPEDVPQHVAAVLGRGAGPSEVRDFYVWCDELGVEKATLCIPGAADRELYAEAVSELEPSVGVVEPGDGPEKVTEERRLSYVGGREEVVEAFRRLAHDVREGQLSPEEVASDTVSERLAVPGEPDLLVEASDDALSDVLVWQTVYSELCRVDELTEEALRRCVEEYGERERRYGR